MFSFEFGCIGEECTAIIAGRIYLAVAEGDGHRYECAECHQLYLIKTDGAHPVEAFDEPMSFVDAQGKPFTLSNWDPSMADIPTPKLESWSHGEEGRKA